MQANDSSWNCQRTEAAGQTTDSTFGKRQDLQGEAGSEPCICSPGADTAEPGWSPEGGSAEAAMRRLWPRVDQCERAALRATDVPGPVWARHPEGHGHAGLLWACHPDGHRHAWTSLSAPPEGHGRLDQCERAALRATDMPGPAWAQHQCERCPEGHGHAWLMAQSRFPCRSPKGLSTSPGRPTVVRRKPQLVLVGAESSHHWKSAQTCLFCLVKNKIPPLQGRPQNRGL